MLGTGEQTMAKEYIEREAALNAISRGNGCGNICSQSINRIPAANVVEVVHGEWIEDGYNEVPCVCSCCGCEAHYTSTFEEKFDYDWEENLQSTGYEEYKEYIRTPYCHNCGAKMDGERKTEND